MMCYCTNSKSFNCVGNVKICDHIWLLVLLGNAPLHNIEKKKNIIQLCDIQFFCDMKNIQEVSLDGLSTILK